MTLLATQPGRLSIAEQQARLRAHERHVAVLANAKADKRAKRALARQAREDARRKEKWEAERARRDPATTEDSARYLAMIYSGPREEYYLKNLSASERELLRTIDLEAELARAEWRRQQDDRAGTIEQERARVDAMRAKIKRVRLRRAG